MKLPKGVDDITRTNLCWRPRALSVFPCFAEYAFLYECLMQALFSLPPSAFIILLFGAPSSFSTWELSPSFRMWHAPLCWRGWLAWDEHEQKKGKCVWCVCSDVNAGGCGGVRKMGVVVFAGWNKKNRYSTAELQSSEVYWKRRKTYIFIWAFKDSET